MKKLLTVILLASLGCNDDANETVRNANSCYLINYKEDDHYSFNVSTDKENRLTKVSEYREPSHSEYDNYGPFLSTTTIYYVNNNEVKILITRSDSETMTVVKINNAGNPVEYLIGNDNRLLEYDISGKPVRQTVDGISHYEYMYDAARNNITKITRYQDGTITGELTVSYDNKRNPLKGSWVLAAAAGLGYFDDLHIYFCDNNPVKYSFEDFQGGDESFEDLIDYEYNDFNFPVRSTTRRTWGGMTEYNQGTYAYDCG